MAHKKNGQDAHDMTKGPILRQLIVFALPLLGSSLVQQLYNTADVFFVGNYAGKNAAAAVGASSLIFTCLIGLFTGLSVGAGIIVAHAWGRGDVAEARKSAGTSLAAGLIGSTVFMVLGLLFARQILLLMNTPASIMHDATVYIRIYFLSIVPMVLYNMASAVFRAEGDSGTPFYILCAAGVLHIVLDAVLVAVLKLDVAGAAASTSISQMVSCVLIMAVLFRKMPRKKESADGTEFVRSDGTEKDLTLSLEDLKIWPGHLGIILNFGLAAGAQSIVITLSNMLVQYTINSYGEDAIAAYTAYFKLEGMVYLPVLACGQAVTTFIGQNFGRHNFDRIRRGVWSSLLMTCVMTAVLAGLGVLFAKPLVGLLIKDETVIMMGETIIMTTFPLYFLYAFVEIFSGAVRGMGGALHSMLTVMVGVCGVRILLLEIILHSDRPFASVARVYPVTWAITGAALMILYLIYFKKRKRSAE